MKNADAIKALGQAVGLPDLALDAENTCSLIVDGTRDIYLSGEPAGSDLRLHAVLGDLMALGADPKLMLEVNYSATESGGGALSVNRMTSEVVYVKSVDVSALDADGFTAAVETFMGYAAFWADHMADLRARDSETLGGETSGFEDETFIRI